MLTTFNHLIDLEPAPMSCDRFSAKLFICDRNWICLKYLVLDSRLGNCEPIRLES